LEIAGVMRFLQTGCHSCHQPNVVKALKGLTCEEQA